MLETQMAEQAARSRLGSGEGGDAGSGCADTQSVISRNAESASTSAIVNASSAPGRTALNSLPPGAEAEAPAQPAAERPHDNLQAHESQQRPMTARLAGPQRFDRPMDFR